MYLILRFFIYDGLDFAPIPIREQDMPGIEPGPLVWHTSTLTTKLQEVSQNSMAFISFYECHYIKVHDSR